MGLYIYFELTFFFPQVRFVTAKKKKKKKRHYLFCIICYFVTSVSKYCAGVF